MTVHLQSQFNEEDPFPLFPANPCAAYTLEQAQRHAREADAWLGLQTEKIENELLHRAHPTGRTQDVQDWVGLPVQALLTPYLEIRSMLHVLQPEDGSRIVDLGAGYARMAWVIGRHYPRVQFTGIELVQERVQESLRCLALRPFPNVTMLQGDLSAPTFLLPVADSYFMYDFGSRMAIQAVLNKLRSIASERRVTVIGRGRSSRDAIEREHPWLSQIVPPVHCGNFSIYRSHDSPKIRP